MRRLPGVAAKFLGGKEPSLNNTALLKCMMRLGNNNSLAKKFFCQASNAEKLQVHSSCKMGSAVFLASKPTCVAVFVFCFFKK